MTAHALHCGAARVDGCAPMQELALLQDFDKREGVFIEKRSAKMADRNVSGFAYGWNKQGEALHTLNTAAPTPRHVPFCVRPAPVKGACTRGRG